MPEVPCYTSFVPAGYPPTGATVGTSINTTYIGDHAWITNCTTATTMLVLSQDGWLVLNNADPAPEPFPAPPAPMDDAAYQAQAANAAARLDRLRIQRRAAIARAEELLTMMLSDEQRADRATHGYFEVVGSNGGRYRIRQGTTGNVRQLNPELVAAGGGEAVGRWREVTSLCAHPPLDVPEGDVHLAQLLALTTDEAAFQRVANISAVR